MLLSLLHGLRLAYNDLCRYFMIKDLPIMVLSLLYGLRIAYH